MRSTRTDRQRDRETQIFGLLRSGVNRQVNRVQRHHGRQRPIAL